MSKNNNNSQEDERNLSIEKRLSKMRTMSSGKKNKLSNARGEESFNKKNGIMKAIKVFFILIVSISVIAISIVAYFVLNAREAWKEQRVENMSKMADYYEVIVVRGNEKKIRYLNPLNPLENTPPTRIYDKNNILIGEYMPASYEIVNPEDITEIFERTLLLMEDQKFYQHKGINIVRTVYLTLQTIVSRRIVGGGSTITQQLAKILFTNSERTIERKLFEMFAAREIEATYNKKAILAMYLNTVYLGDGNYGFEAASRYYFKKPLNQCRPVECAILVGILSNPTYFSPIKNPANSKAKVRQILNRLVRHGVLTSEEAKEEFELFDTHYSDLVADISASQLKMTVNRAPYVNEYVRQILSRHFEEGEGKIGFEGRGFRIYTTIDIRHYEASERSVKNTIRELQRETSDRTMQAALVTIDPNTGAILSMIGGDEYKFDNQFNRATSARRQIGSAVKPFIYAYAFEMGQFPFSVMEDKLYSYPQGLGRDNWAPRNYSGNFKGNVRLDDAIAQSINTISVKLLEEIGLSYFYNNMSKILSGNFYMPNDLSIGLGTIEVTPLELARVYSAFANNSTIENPYIIERIIQTNDRQLDLTDIVTHYSVQMPSVSEASMYFLNTSLQKVLQPSGTGYRSAQAVGFDFPISAKSGTTSDYRDAWFVVYYDDIVSVIWIGSDSNNKLPDGFTGGAKPAQTILSYLKRVTPNYVKNFSWQVPADVSIVHICNDSGLPANDTCISIDSIMLSGLDPNVKCSIDHRRMGSSYIETGDELKGAENSIKNIILEDSIIDPTAGVIIE